MTKKLPSDDPRHGTLNGYNNCGCRCDLCKLANRQKQAQRREALRRTLASDDPRHGTLTGYIQYSCRCIECRNTNRKYMKQRRKEKKERTSETLLVAVKDVASYFGVRPNTVRYWMKKSEDSDWPYESIPKPFKKVSCRVFWTLEQLSSDWEVWYRNFLKDKARQTLKMSQEYEESRT